MCSSIPNNAFIQVGRWHIKFELFCRFFIECKDEWMIIIMIDVELWLIIVHYWSLFQIWFEIFLIDAQVLTLY
jgi:hypothetical protein